MTGAKRADSTSRRTGPDNSAKGAYLLVIDLSAPLTLSARALAGQVLEPGRYAYCGSAYGPGGLDGRLRRHLRAVKRRHWHVDELTLGGKIAAVAALPGDTECRLVAELRCLPGVAVPLPGFGSSDCRRCPAHLLQLPADLDLVRLDLPWIEVLCLCDPPLS